MRIVAVLAFLLASAVAQKPPDGRLLDQVLAAFAEQLDQLYRDGKAPTREQESDLRQRQLKELEAFLTHEARGDDRFRARTLLADMCLQVRQRDRAIAALAPLDSDATPFAHALRGAETAMTAGDVKLRDALLARAKKSAASLPDRMEIVRAMVTTLRLVADGEALADAELRAATDDEQRAFVRWLRCKAERDREDLPENSYYEALEKLASELPKTRWGSVAKDRCEASKFQVGAAAFAFRLQPLAGAEISSESLRGKAVALLFCGLENPASNATLQVLMQQRNAHRDDLAVFVIATDADCKAAARAAEKIGDGAVVCCTGEGMDSDPLLRFCVETTPTVIAIDRKGAIAGLNLHCETKDAQQEFEEAIARALKK